MFVSGANGISVIGSVAAASVARSSSTACTPTALRRDGAEVEVAHPVRTVHVPGGSRHLDERPGHAPRDRDVRRVDGVEHLERVCHHLIDIGVAVHARDRQHIQRRGTAGEEDRERVVDTGVDVKDHLHLVILSARRSSRPPSRSGGSRST